MTRSEIRSPRMLVLAVSPGDPDRGSTARSRSLDAVETPDVLGLKVVVQSKASWIRRAAR